MILKFSNLLILTISLGLPIQFVKAADLVSKPEFDWTKDANVDFCADSNSFDYRNAYWLGAVSYYSYWHLKYIDPLYKAQPGSPVEINFEIKDKIFSKPNQTKATVLRGMGFGSLRSTYFSSRLLMPNAGHDYTNLVSRWTPPLPGEACIKPEMYFCFGPAVANVDPTPDLVAACGKNNEKAFFEMQRLRSIQDFVNGKVMSFKSEERAIADKKYIDGIIKKYEQLKLTDAHLDWQDVRVSERCEQYKIRERHPPDTQTAVYENKDSIIIVFRGTEEDNINDIMTDLLASIKIDLSKMGKSVGKIHQGFYKAYSVMQNWVLREIKEIRRLRPESVSKPIFITGHSLGGALANLLMYDLLEYNDKEKNKEGFQSLNLRALYSFGAPRLGNGVWAKRFKELADQANVGIYRMVNRNDLVPHVPCGDYVHMGSLVYMDATQANNIAEQVVNVIANPLDSMLSAVNLYSSYSACGIATAFLAGPRALESMITDHYMPSYYNDLVKLRNALNQRFSVEEVKLKANGDTASAKEMQYPLNCKLNSRTPQLEGALKLNFQILNNEIEGNTSVF